MEWYNKLGLGICAVGISAIIWAGYMIKSDKSGADLDALQNTGRYVMEYEGNPQNAINCARDSLKMAREASNVSAEYMSELESRINEIDEAVDETTSKTLYEPLLDSLGSRMNKIGYETRGGNPLGMPIMLVGLIATIAGIRIAAED